MIINHYQGSLLNNQDSTYASTLTSMPSHCPAPASHSQSPWAPEHLPKDERLRKDKVAPGFLLSMLHWCFGLFTYPMQFIYSFIHLFIHSFIYSFIPSFVRSFVGSFIRFFDRFSLLRSFVHAFVLWFFRSFTSCWIKWFKLPINCAWQLFFNLSIDWYPRISGFLTCNLASYSKVQVRRFLRHRHFVSQNLSNLIVWQHVLQKHLVFVHTLQRRTLNFGTVASMTSEDVHESICYMSCVKKKKVFASWRNINKGITSLWRHWTNDLLSLLSHNKWCQTPIAWWENKD